MALHVCLVGTVVKCGVGCLFRRNCYNMKRCFSLVGTVIYFGFLALFMMEWVIVCLFRRNPHEKWLCFLFDWKF